MALLNIGTANQNDIHYRYKREQAEVNNTGKGKNEKTVIQNLEQISKQLMTLPEYILKFLALRFCCQGTYDKKSKIWFIKGKYSMKQIEEQLTNYIDLYVCCHECHNPETILKAKSGKIRMRCYACGSTSYPNDREDKRDTFYKCLKKLVQEPPDAYKKKKAKQSENKKKETEKEDLMFEIDGIENIPLPPDDEIEWFTDTSEQAVNQRKTEGKTDIVERLLNQESWFIYY